MLLNKTDKTKIGFKIKAKYEFKRERTMKYSKKTNIQKTTWNQYKLLGGA